MEFDKPPKPIHVFIGLVWGVAWTWFIYFLDQVSASDAGTDLVIFLSYVLGVGIGFVYAYWRFE
jgi:NhaP-type Na+/H+ or K+/H+ antiporter